MSRFYGSLCILNAVRCPYVRTSVTVDVASSVANDVTTHNENHVIMRTGAPRRHNENDVTMAIAGLWRYGDWRHVATGFTALHCVSKKFPPFNCL